MNKSKSSIAQLATMCLPAMIVTLLPVTGISADSNEKVVVFNLTNNSSLDDGEVDFLSKAVVSAMLDLTADGYQVVRGEIPEGCQGDCITGAAMAAGGSYYTVGQVVDFGGGRAVSLDLFQVAGPTLLVSDTSVPVSEQSALIQAAKDITESSRQKLRSLATSKKSPPPPIYKATAVPGRNYNSSPAASAYGGVSSPRPRSGPTGLLSVTSSPPNAKVYIGGTQATMGAYAGTTPVRKELLPRKYWLRLESPGYEQHMEAIAVFAGDTIVKNISLIPTAAGAAFSDNKEDSSWGKLIIAGHCLAWPGLAVVAVSVPLSFEGTLTGWGSVALVAVGGAILVTGLTLLIVGSIKKSKRSNKRSGPVENW